MKYLTTISLRMVIFALCISAATMVMADDPGFGLYQADFSPFTGQDKGNDFVDCSGKTGNAYWALKCTRQNGIESVHHKSVTAPTGLTGKVTARVNASSPRSGSSAKGRVGSYNYQTSDAHLAWVAERNARLAEQRQRDAEAKARREHERRIADDNRAAAVEAETNARLQVQTDRAIARDHWHANQGAQQAQQRARSAHKMQGPQLASSQNRMSNAQKASMLRQGNPRRLYQKPRVTYRSLPPVRRTQVSQAQLQAQRLAMQRKAEYVAKQRELARKRQEELARATAAKKAEIEKRYADNRQIVAIGRSKVAFKLSSNASSSLGKDWKTVSLTTPPIPERKKMTEEDWHRLKVIEIIENRPMTPAEKAYFDQF